MSQHCVRFELQDLARILAKAVGSASCLSVKKYPDGMYNEAFLMTMDDGKEAVAKIPNPNAGRPHFTTASEVVTMEFLRFFDLAQVNRLRFYRFAQSLGLLSQRYTYGVPKLGTTRWVLSTSSWKRSQEYSLMRIGQRRR